MLLSLVIPYRNREELRVKRCLDSLAAQKFQDFEMIFVDYGSKNTFAKPIENLCKQYKNMTYIYAFEEGHFWNRSHAINIGIQSAAGKYVMTVDIDMIYAPNFLENAFEKLEPQKLIHYQCFYLPEKFKNYDNLTQVNFSSFETSDKTSAKGIFILATDILKKIGAFDEFYKVWGMEDMDLHRRLAFQKLEVEWLDLEKSPVFHQWHANSDEKENMPKGWKQVMIDYYHAKTDSDIINKNGVFGKICQKEERLFFAAENHLPQTNFTFVYPFALSLAKFSHIFTSLQSHERLTVSQQFDFLPTQAESSAAKFFKKVNQWLEKSKISYRMVELLTYQRELISYYEVRDFIFYFMLMHQDLMADYYFEYSNHKIELTLIKK